MINKLHDNIKTFRIQRALFLGDLAKTCLLCPRLFLPILSLFHEQKREMSGGIY